MRIDGLTPQQLRVAQMVADGDSDKSIAETLHISERGVQYLVGRIADTWALDRTRNIRVQIANRVREAA